MAQLGEGALEDDVTGLPVVEAVERDRAVTPTKAAQYALGIALLSWQLEPEDVHRRRGLDRLEPCQTPDAGAPSVGADREHRPHLVLAVVPLVADAPDHAVFLDQFPYPGTHHQPEVRVALGLFGNEL